MLHLVRLWDGRGRFNYRLTGDFHFQCVPVSRDDLGWENPSAASPMAEAYGVFSG